MTTNRESRTTAATAARMRASEEKKAELLRQRGWTVEPPEGETQETDRVSDSPDPLP